MRTVPSNKRFLTLMLTMVIAIMATPVVAELTHSLRFGGIILVFVLAASVNAVQGSRRLRRVVLGLAVLSFLFGAARVLDDQIAIELGSGIAVVLALVLTAVAIVRHIFATHEMSAEDIFAAICVFLIAGLIWAILYWMLWLIVPGAFRFPDAEVPETSTMIYFSFVTLTTLGYGDIFPTAVAVRMLTIAEATFGQLYIAVLIAHLVGRAKTRPATEDHGP